MLRKLIRTLCPLACLSSLLVVSPPALLSQATPPSADTFVSSATPKVNYGPSIILVVQQGATSYLQFNLSAIPAGAQVSKATLRLYVDGVLKPGSFDVYQLNAPWSENSLTYNTPPPALGNSATGGNPVSVTAASLNQFLMIDITPTVQAWVNGTLTNNGVALAVAGTGSGVFSFDSKESILTGNGPNSKLSLMARPAPPDRRARKEFRVFRARKAFRDSAFKDLRDPCCPIWSTPTRATLSCKTRFCRAVS